MAKNKTRNNRKNLKQKNVGTKKVETHCCVSKTKRENIKYLPLFIIPLFLVSVFFLGLGKNQKVLSYPKAKGESILKYEKESIALGNVEKTKIPFLKNPEAEKELDVSAESYLVYGLDLKAPILAKNEKKKSYIASLTKLMTAVVAVENKNLNDIVKVHLASSTPSPNLGLVSGENIYLKDLLQGILVGSNNDAAEAVADFVSPGDYLGFADLMNKKAIEIGMPNSHFSNAMGLDNEANYSTAQDLMYLAFYALDNDFIKNTVSIKEKDTTSLDKKHKHSLENTNELLFDQELNVLGVKTGQTPEAGGCLITYFQTKNGQEYVAVVLGSADRFGDTKKVIKWVEENIIWQ